MEDTKKHNFNFIYLICIIFILTFLILIAGCGPAPECKNNADCNSRFTCYAGLCEKGSCVKGTAKNNCCGNGKCEQSIGETRCSCAADCKPACNGNITVSTDSRGKPVSGKYLKYICNENYQCIIGINKTMTSVTPLQLSTDNDIRDFRVSTTLLFNNPFDINADSLGVIIELKDASNQIQLPVEITHLALKSGDRVYSAKDEQFQLNNIGDKVNDSLKISTRPDKREQALQLTLVVDYKYTKISSTKPEIVRSSYSTQFNEQMMLLDTTPESG